jgi:hypothetical protein
MRRSLGVLGPDSVAPGGREYACRHSFRSPGPVHTDVYGDGDFQCPARGDRRAHLLSYLGAEVDGDTDSSSQRHSDQHAGPTHAHGGPAYLHFDAAAYSNAYATAESDPATSADLAR